MRRLTFERQNHHISQAAVAAATRIPQPTLSQIERGRFIPTAAQLERLAAFFRVPPDDLLKHVTVLVSR